MASAIQNALQLLKHPRLAREYVRYQYSALRNGGEAKRHLFGGLEISGFSGFSEYQSCVEYVSESEYVFLTTHEFGKGAVLDVGANLGIVTAILARRFAEHSIHAFEPNPSAVETLQQNCRVNQLTNVTVAPVAVAQEAGEVTFNAHPTHRATAKITGSNASHAETVPCVSLDHYAQQNGLDEIALLKVDTEGHELPVFRGAQHLLESQKIGAVYYEVCPTLAKRAGFDPEAASRVLSRNDYQLFRLDEQATLVPVKPCDVQGVALQNWVALR